jgi:hypothetical protein
MGGERLASARPVAKGALSADYGFVGLRTEDVGYWHIDATAITIRLKGRRPARSLRLTRQDETFEDKTGMLNLGHPPSA